jgi:hypothetical protein
MFAVAAHGTTPDTATLSTSDTRLTLEAGAHAPRLAALGGRSGWRLESRSAETLPDHAEVGGAMRPLNWQLDRTASHNNAAEITLVYRSEASALSLRSHWRARAPSGPIEHSIEIQNLGNETLWLPLQPSLTFD